MDEIKIMKEKSINDYISNIILKDNEFDTEKMKEDLGNILNEKPGIELNYETIQLVQEAGKKTIRKEKLESISIYYTYDDAGGNLRFGTLTYLTD